MPQLNFSLLGHLQIRHSEWGAVNLTNCEAIGLLAYLLVESDHAHGREFSSQGCPRRRKTIYA